MAPNARTRAKSTTKPTTNATKTTVVLTPTPTRQPTPPPAPIPMAGTPITVNQTHAPTPPNDIPPQEAMPKTPIQIAQDGLEIALEHLKTSYLKSTEKLKNGEAPEKIIVETPFRIFEEIGYKVTEALHHLSQHVTQTENIEEHFSRLERSLKETIASTARRTYAQTTATPEPNHVREIQQRNLERKVQQRREQNKLDIVLTMKGMDSDTKEKLAQHPHTEITTKLQQTIESQVKDNYPIIHGIEKLKSQDI